MGARCWVRLSLLLLVVPLNAAELPPPNLVPAPLVDMLQNSGFEDTSSGAWRFADWPPRAETSDRLVARSVYYHDADAYAGAHCLGFDLGTVGPDRVLLAQQQISLEQLQPYAGRRVRMSGWIRVLSGPAVVTADLTMRQWGEPGTPPFGGGHVRMNGVRDHWLQFGTELTLGLGPTQRADIGVALRSAPASSEPAVVLIDDLQLTALLDPPLAVDRLAGVCLFAPDDRLPLRVRVSADAWSKAMRCLRWDVTSADGLRSHGHGDLTLSEPLTVVEAVVPEIQAGAYAVRLALGRTAGGRTHEVLVPFERVGGPFAR